MGEAPVDDMRALHTVLHRPQARLHLGDHSRFERGQQGPELRGSDRGEQRSPVRPVGVQALDVGQDHQFRGAEGFRERCRGAVRVDVEHLLRGISVVVDLRGDRRDDGDAPGLQDVEDGTRVDTGDLTHEAEVHVLPVHHGAGADGLQEAAVLPRESDGVGAVRVDEAHEFAPHRAGQDHADHVHGLGRGDTQPALELRGDAKTFEHGVDLRASPMDHHGADAHVVQEHDVLGEGAAHLLVDHGVSAVLDDHGGAGEPLDPGKRLDQGGGFVLCQERVCREGDRCHGLNSHQLE